MATKTSPVTRTDAIDVTDPDQARALAAAWDGIYHFFGGRVAEWVMLPPSEDNPIGGLVANGFSVSTDLTVGPEKVLEDIGKRNRRLEMFPNYFWLFGNVTPPEFTNPQDMTNFMVQYLKGSVEEGTAKTPEYVRNAVSAYKAAAGLRTRRGPRRKIIRLDEIGKIDQNQLAEIPEDQLNAFLELAQGIAKRNAAKANGNGSKATTNAETTEAVPVS